MAGKPQAAPGIHWEQVAYGEWVIVFRRLKLDAPLKCVGYALASYADWNTGRDAFPGIHELATATGYRSNHTIIDALKALRDLKLIERRVRGNREGRRGNADMYYLTLTNPLREQAGVDPCQCKPKPKPAPDADPWAALRRSGARRAHGQPGADLVRNECRTGAELVHVMHMVLCRTGARRARQLRTNHLTIYLPIEEHSRARKCSLASALRKRNAAAMRGWTP